MRRIADTVREEYLEWLMTPPAQREPATKVAMAEKLGVAFKTLYNWEKEPMFREALRNLKSVWGTRWHGDILGRLMEIVENGPAAQSVNAAKVLLAHLDLGEVEGKEKEPDSEALERIRAALKAEGYTVVEKDA